jgi:TonB family protein
MRVQLSPSIDFNQMLVFSVFGHLLLLTAVLFLPKPSLPDKVVVPAFMVNLVNEPMGSKAAAPKRSKPPVKVEKPKVKKPKVKKLSPKVPALKKTKVSKPTVVKEVPQSKGILAELNKLETNRALPPKKKMVEELDQLARLERPKQKPLASKPIKKKTVTEETFRELEALKNKRIDEVKAVAPAPLQEDILKNFEEIKMEESLLEEPQKEISVESLQKLEPEQRVPEKPQVPEVDLLKELQQLAKLDATPVPEVAVVKPLNSTEKSSESFDSVMEKLGSLSVDSEPVKVEVSSAKLDATSFQSKLRTLPKTTHTPSESGTGDSYVFTKKEGVPGADMQSLYVGMIQEKIYKNWREPLAEEHNQETVVSFFIYPRGNVDKPFIKKSSGVEALDTLAVRAVLDSVPFPEFPQELKMSNLHINIYFKYVPKDE